MLRTIGIVIGVLLWVASVAGSFYFGVDYAEAKQAQLKQVIEETRKVSMEEAAYAISKITVRNTTVQGRVETVVRDNPVYRDCQHAPEQLRNINEALTGRTGPVGDSSLPRANAIE